MIYFIYFDDFDVFLGLDRTVVVAAFAANIYSHQRLLARKGFGRRECWKPTFPQEPSTTTCWFLGCLFVELVNSPTQWLGAWGPDLTGFVAVALQVNYMNVLLYDYDYNYNCKCNVYYKLWFNSRLVIRCYTDTDRYGYGTRIRSDQARGSKSGIDWKTGQKAILPTGLHLYTGGFECQDSWTDWTSALHRWWWMLQNQWPVGLHWQDLSTLNVSRKKLDLNITEETLHCSGARRSLQSSVSQSMILWCTIACA